MEEWHFRRHIGTRRAGPVGTRKGRAGSERTGRPYDAGEATQGRPEKTAGTRELNTTRREDRRAQVIACEQEAGQDTFGNREEEDTHDPNTFE